MSRQDRKPYVDAKNETMGLQETGLTRAKEGTSAAWRNVVKTELTMARRKTLGEGTMKIARLPPDRNPL